MNMQNKAADHRKFQRLPKEVKVEVNVLQYPLSTDGGEITSSKNISPHGLCFNASTPFAPKTILTINIHLTGWQRHKKSLSYRLDEQAQGKPLSVIAEVIWCSQNEPDGNYEIGVRFHDIHDDDFQAMKKFLISYSTHKTT